MIRKVPSRRAPPPPKLVWPGWGHFNRLWRGLEGEALRQAQDKPDRDIQAGLYSGATPTGYTRQRARKRWWLWGPVQRWQEAEYKVVSWRHGHSMDPDLHVDVEHKWYPVEADQ